ACAEDEVARRDLVAERLADLRDPERNLLARGLLHDREVDEHPLRRLGSEVGLARLVLDGAHVRLEHQVELPWLGEALLTAVRAGRVLAEMILAEPLVAVQAFDQRVVEARHMATRLPEARGHDDRGLQADDVVAELDHRAPPGVADVATELHPQRTVVPGRAQAPVDLAGLEGDPPSLGEGRDGLHQVGQGEASSPGRWLRPLACAPVYGSARPRSADPCGEMASFRTSRSARSTARPRRGVRPSPVSRSRGVGPASAGT